MELNQQTRDFIERMGLIMERMGTAKTLGRLLGLLLVAENPMSLDELAEQLQVSKASISTNARLCSQIRLVQQVSLPGDRRDYYKILPGSFERVLEVRLRVMHDMIQLLEDGLAGIDRGNRTARSRLQEMRDFYRFVGNQVNGIQEQWKSQRRVQES